jgi:ankyrin repeat protein
VALLAIAGCDRRSIADQGKPSRSEQATAAAAVARDDAPSEEKDPAKRLVSAMLVRDVNRVRAILKEHPEVVNKSVSGVTPIWRAAESRSLDLVKAVVDAGADVNVYNEEKQTPLWAAVSADSLETVQYLISRGADPRLPQTEWKMTVLWPAESREIAALLMAAGLDPKYRDTTGDTAMHQACRHAVRDVVELYLDRGFPIENRDGYNMTPLHSAASTCWKDARPTVTLLLERGADIKARGYQGHTVLHECALFNLTDMAIFLVRRGADVDLKDDEGRTPKQTAEWAGKDNRKKLIEILVNNGAKGIKVLDKPNQDPQP